jgi:putative acetyltransferase
MESMIEILPIQPNQIADAKYVICAVAQRIFQPEKSVEEFVDIVMSMHELDDMDDYQRIYTENRGLFLVVLDDGKVIGTGAVRKLEEHIAELKRIWLLEDYHGRQIGYRTVSMLLDFARQHGYTSVRLETGHLQQRAIAFYKKMGFYEIPAFHEGSEGVSMEILL